MAHQQNQHNKSDGMAAQVSITEVKPDQLHDVWPWMEPALNDVLRKSNQRDRVADWLPPDVYTSLRTSQSKLYAVSRGARTLGFIILLEQRLPYSQRLELFVWIAWALPLRLRQPDDDMASAIAHSRQFIINMAQGLRAEAVTFISSRGRRRYWKSLGFEEAYTVWKMRIGP